MLDMAVLAWTNEGERHRGLSAAGASAARILPNPALPSVILTLIRRYGLLVADENQKAREATTK